MDEGYTDVAEGDPSNRMEDNMLGDVSKEFSDELCKHLLVLEGVREKPNSEKTPVNSSEEKSTGRNNKGKQNYTAHVSHLPLFELESRGGQPAVFHRVFHQQS